MQDTLFTVICNTICVRLNEYVYKFVRSLLGNSVIDNLGNYWKTDVFCVAADAGPSRSKSECS